MSTSYTPNLRFQKPATADRNWDIPLNANADGLDRLNGLSAGAVVPAETPSASLNVRVAPTTFKQSGGGIFAYAGATVTVTPSTTTYIWINDGGTLGLGSAFPGGPIVRLASVLAGAGTVTSVTDQRIYLVSF